MHLVVRQGESSVETFHILTHGEKAMTFVPRKGLEVDLAPHLTNARNRLDDLPRLPKDAEPAQLDEWLEAISQSISRVVQSLRNLPPRVQTAIADAAMPENEAAGRLLLDEVELAIHHAERVLIRVRRGQEILPGGVDANQAQYLTKSLEQEISILADDHLARVEDAAAGGALRGEWLKPLTEAELRDTKLQTNDTDRRRNLLSAALARARRRDVRAGQCDDLGVPQLCWWRNRQPAAAPPSDQFIRIDRPCCQGVGNGWHLSGCRPDACGLQPF